jgi:hypothetical protein
MKFKGRQIVPSTHNMKCSNQIIKIDHQLYGMKEVQDRVTTEEVLEETTTSIREKGTTIPQGKMTKVLDNVANLLLTVVVVAVPTSTTTSTITMETNVGAMIAQEEAALMAAVAALVEDSQGNL